MTPRFPLRLRSGMLFVDNSYLSDFTSCPRKGCYKHLSGRQLRKSRAALFFGSAIHKALEVRDLAGKLMVDNEVRSAMIEAVAELYDGVDMDGDYRNLDYCIQTIDRYNEVYRFDPLKPILLPTPTGEQVPAVELPFALPLGTISVNRTLSVIDSDFPDGKPRDVYIGELPIVFTGKKDRLTKSQNEFFLMDHKTTSMGGPTFFDEFYISNQFKGYKWAAEQLTGEHFSGVIINGLVCRPPKADGTVNYTFDRHTIYISDDAVDEWKVTMLLSVHEWIRQIVHQSDFDEYPERAFPMRTSSCVTKYGKCEYFDACMMPCSQRRMTLESGLFEDHSWSPLDDNAKPKPAREAMEFGNLFDHLSTPPQ